MNSKEKINCIIIHGCPSNKEKAMNPETRTYDKHWIPWIKEKLDNLDIKAETPLMPAPWEPNYDDFKKEFERCDIKENTILVGHSCGSSFLVRWLGESKQKVKKLILVTPFKIPKEENDSVREAFYAYEIDEGIKSRVEDIIMFTTDNEHEKGKKSLEIFHKKLGGKIVNIKGMGHYILRDMGTEEFPELLEEIIR